MTGNEHMAIGPMVPPVKSWEDRKRKNQRQEKEGQEGEKKARFDELILSAQASTQTPHDDPVEPDNDQSIIPRSRIDFRA